MVRGNGRREKGCRVNWCLDESVVRLSHRLADGAIFHGGGGVFVHHAPDYRVDFTEEQASWELECGVPESVDNPEWYGGQVSTNPISG